MCWVWGKGNTNRPGEWGRSSGVGRPTARGKGDEQGKSCEGPHRPDGAHREVSPFSGLVVLQGIRHGADPPRTAMVTDGFLPTGSLVHSGRSQFSPDAATQARWKPVRVVRVAGRAPGVEAVPQLRCSSESAPLGSSLISASFPITDTRQVAETRYRGGGLWVSSHHCVCARGRRASRRRGHCHLCFDRFSLRPHPILLGFPFARDSSKCLCFYCFRQGYFCPAAPTSKPKRLPVRL